MKIGLQVNHACDRCSRGERYGIRAMAATAKFLCSAIVLALAMSKGTADELDDKIKAAAHDQAMDLARCTGTESMRLGPANKGVSAAVLADAALQECSSKIHAIYAALVGPPTSMSPADAEVATERVVVSLRKNLIELITQPPTEQ